MLILINKHLLTALIMHLLKLCGVGVQGDDLVAARLFQIILSLALVLRFLLLDFRFLFT